GNVTARSSRSKPSSYWRIVSSVNPRCSTRYCSASGDWSSADAYPPTIPSVGGVAQSLVVRPGLLRHALRYLSGSCLSAPPPGAPTTAASSRRYSPLSMWASQYQQPIQGSAPSVAPVTSSFG